ncbi:hypothetical protein FPSE5266_00615 [Fusarium pseudograminearum]|nr:hypothetical protein FPSE5266_00615 [Fusarium pseudograminearum]
MENPTTSLPIRQPKPSPVKSTHIFPVAVGPFPIACLEEHQLIERYKRAYEIEKHIQKYEPDFRIRVEHFATILLVPLQDFEKRGLFSPETSDPLDLKDRLECISPFCKHYMLHLDPKETLKPVWKHARPIPPGNVVQPLTPGMGYNEAMKAMHSRAAFRTYPKFYQVPNHVGEQEENKCRVRDQYKCVLTGKHNPSVFWFIPKGWNDNVLHNDATGNLEAGCIRLAKIDLLDDIISSTELGKTHKVWNMLCVDKDIDDLLKKGLGAFKYIGKEKVDGQVKVQLKFFWMPDLPGRFNQVIDLNQMKGLERHTHSNGATSFDYNRIKRENIREISVDLSIFQRDGCLKPRSDRWPTNFNLQLNSARTVYIEMSERESELFESVVKIHWACVTFTALCGGAGRPWFLTGKDQENGSLQPMDEEFRSHESRMRAEQAQARWQRREPSK